MIPKQIQVETRLFDVSRTIKVGRKTVSAPKGQVYLTDGSGDTYPVVWPMRLHSETHYEVIKN